MRLQSADAAEDLLQELYLKLATRPPTGAIENPIAYLLRLGGNLMLDRMKAQRRTAAREQAWRDVRVADVGGVDVSEEPRADEVLAAKQRLQSLVRALEDLPPKTRTIFRMHKLEGMGQSEVAEAVGLSRSAVEKHISTAIKALLAKVGG